MLVFTCSYGSPNTRLQPGHPVPAKRMQNMKRREGTNYRHVNTNKRKRLLSFLPPFAILTYYLVIHATVVLFFFFHGIIVVSISFYDLLLIFCGWKLT